MRRSLVHLPHVTPVDRSTRRALLYLERYSTSGCQPVSRAAHGRISGWEHGLEMLITDTDPWNSAHIASDKQLVEIYEIELIMSLRDGDSLDACQRVAR